MSDNTKNENWLHVTGRWEGKVNDDLNVLRWAENKNDTTIDVSEYIRRCN